MFLLKIYSFLDEKSPQTTNEPQLYQTSIAIITTPVGFMPIKQISNITNDESSLQYPQVTNIVFNNSQSQENKSLNESSETHFSSFQHPSTPPTNKIKGIASRFIN